jgi:predicted AAA+ superfamily ATPase
MLTEIPRILQLTKIIEKKSAFWLGPRSTGKSYWLKKQFPGTPIINLLRSDERFRYLERPSLLQETVQALPAEMPVLIDEIQMVPDLLNEVHDLIEEKKRRFLLTGSSARKLKRENANMLGGRATRIDFFPLTWRELQSAGKFDLNRYLLYGGLPRVYLGETPRDELSDYVDTYLDQEIKAEAISRNILGFENFLRRLSLVSGETIVYSNIARDAQISPPTVRHYVEVLEDTLLGFHLVPWNSPKRKAIQSARFFLFDLGLKWFLGGVESIPEASQLYGQAFEQFIVLETRSYLSYRRKKIPLYFWRTTHHDEVDLILGDQLAIEIKSKRKADSKDARGLVKLHDEGFRGQRMVVSRDPINREKDGISYCYWETFLEKLWQDHWG